MGITGISIIDHNVLPAARLPDRVAARIADFELPAEQRQLDENFSAADGPGVTEQLGGRAERHRAVLTVPV